MKKVCVIGHFGFGKNLFNGQTVKTKIFTDELERQLGENEILKVDTHGGKITSIIKAPFQVIKALRNAKNVVIFPAHNGLRLFTPLLWFFRIFFKQRRLHYVVIGGWLPDFLEKRPALVKKLKKFDWIYVETETMKNALEKQGFKNIVIMPNCKKLRILDESELIYPRDGPLKLCTFSRVMKEKGIEDAVKAVIEINSKHGKTVYTLDIYGQIDANQTQWFEELQLIFPEYVKYCGLVDFDKSVDVLKNYFALLFPTKFFTEGIPGTIIDAYAAGIPVISSEWENFSDIVESDITGLGYNFDDTEALKAILLKISNNVDFIVDLKSNCIKKAIRYAPENVVQVLLGNL